MLFNYSTKGRMKSLGNTPPIPCPCCGASVSMLVLQAYDNFYLVGVPVKEVDKSYFATCPACAQVFAVEEEQGGRFSKGDVAAVTPQGLSLPEKGASNEAR